MKNYVIVFIFFVVTSGIDAQNWKTVKYLDYSFRVDFPNEEIKSLEQDVPVDGKVFKMNMFYVDNAINTVTPNLLYAIAHVAYNEDDYAENDAERDKVVLDNALLGSVKNLKGQVLEERAIELNGFPGKYAKIEMTGTYIYLKLYLVKHELYFAQVFCPIEKDDNLEINTFFDSFDLIKIK